MKNYCISQINSVLISKVLNTSTNFKYSCCYTKLPDSGDSSECTACSFVTDPASSATDVVQESFEEGGTLFFVTDGWSGLVKVKSIYLDDSNLLRFVVTDSIDNHIVTMLDT